MPAKRDDGPTYQGDGLIVQIMAKIIEERKPNDEQHCKIVFVEVDAGLREATGPVKPPEFVKHKILLISPVRHVRSCDDHYNRKHLELFRAVNQRNRYKVR